MAPVRRAAVAMVSLACGCAGGESGASGKRALSPDDAERTALRHDSGSSPTVTRAARPRAEASARASLDNSDVDGQVRELRKAIALYGQFIERAAGQPEMKEAVERSRARIEDAEETIRFLLQGAPPEQR